MQGCIFHLLGLELIKSDGDKQEFAAQTIRFPDEEDLEALCKMLATAGKKFDQPKTKTIMNIIILRLVELSEDTKLPSRARFLIKDLLEMRDHMWEPRRAVRHLTVLCGSLCVLGCSLLCNMFVCTGNATKDAG